MDTNKKFSIALFGFSKKKVNEYILELCKDFSQQIEELKGKCEKYEKSIAEKDEKIAGLDRERMHIAETLLKSKCEADKILSDAQEQAAKITQDVQNQAETILSDAKKNAEELVMQAQIEANHEKLEGKRAVSELEKQKAYVAQCINSLKLDVLSAYEVYMLKLEKSMQHSGVIEAKDECIEVLPNGEENEKKKESENGPEETDD